MRRRLSWPISTAGNTGFGSRNTLFAVGEEPDRDGDHLDAVQELRHAEGEARLPGLVVDAHQADGEAERKAREPAQCRFAEHR